MSYQARVTKDGLQFSIGRYETKARADIARRLSVHWLKRGYRLSQIRPKHQKKTERSNQYVTLPGMNGILIRVKADLTLSFAYKFYIGKKYYANYGYDSLAKAVHSRDNARKKLGLMIEG